MKGVFIALLCSCLCGVLNAQNNTPTDGKHVYSYANGTDSVICFYKNGRLIGQRTEYYPSGQLHLAFTYKEGRLISLKQYYENGALKREEVNKGLSTEGHLYDIDGKELEFIPYMELPQFPGGNAELMKLISQYVKYPKKAVEERKQGLVVISCMIDKEGNPKEARVVKSVCPELDEEAMRVVGFLTMTYKFTPGKIEGNPANMRFNIPVNFRL
ncbi:MAG: TonB family protein [Bacteroides sp.]|nr:TonB family protein [Bacteroides sp.]